MIKNTSEYYYVYFINFAMGDQKCRAFRGEVFCKIF